jgi:hypothetical protein
MKFIRVMEQTGSVEDARTEIEEHFETADEDTNVRKFVLCADRDVAEKIVSLVEFDSWDSAGGNNDLDATQEGAAKSQSTTGITHQNLDVHHEWVR